MKFSSYLDCHTHSIPQNSQHLSLYVLALNEKVPRDIEAFCIGLHPWDQTKIYWKDWVAQNEQLFVHPKCWAIGEIGFDNIKTPVFNEKWDYLTYFFTMALNRKKPIVLHLVKATQELYEFLMQNPKFQSIPIIIHAYHGNIEQTKLLLRFPIYFSLGPRELKRKSTTEELKNSILSRLLLETDDSNTAIEEVYQLATQYFSEDLKSIQAKIRSNFQMIFPLSKSLLN